MRKMWPPYVYVVTQRAMMIGALLLLNFFLSASAVVADGRQQELAAIAKTTAPVYDFRVKGRFAHDRNAFTQGLVFHNDYFYESTGLYGQSTLRQVKVATGGVERMVRLPKHVFGEGLTLYDNKLIQLTWRSRTGFVFDRESLRLERKFGYKTEGWGLTHNGEHLIMSDGSDTLYFLDPETFSVVRSLSVTDGDNAIDRLNELEYVKGEIFANVWYSDHIARIDPKSGRIKGWIDLSGLVKQLRLNSKDDVLNGIAFDAKGERLFVTGKRWPVIFEIELFEPSMHRATEPSARPP